MSTSAFTCITCRVAFADADLQRSHYKTDWHRYNLKRKVAALPHVTADGFNQRVLAQRAQAAVAEESKISSCYCEPCGKKIASEAAYENHINSSKHKARVAKVEEQKQFELENLDSVKTPKVREAQDVEMTEAAGTSSSQEKKMDTDDGDEEEVEEWEEDVLGIEECLFCSKISKSLEANVKHMTSAHSFFIPDVEYLVDLEGLISYLGEKIGSGKMCLWCNDRSKIFHSVKATQQHMVDKGHCMLLHEGDAAYEYADFYDYVKSYPECETADPDEEINDNVIDIDDDEFEMTLPSGAKIGHRALAKYYKQNLTSRLHPDGRNVIGKVMNHYKALGWTGATGSAAIELRVKDLRHLQRTKYRHSLQVGIKSNKTAQTHFRNQIMF